ncbi:MAG: Fe-S cluster assembly protein IscX [Deltaproteobacteria bacterium]|nr:Fe-S cluster assembly protein IscX [Deltaproteobacteria bacterium]
MVLKWTSVDEIAELLHDGQPDRDPLGVRFTELRDLIMALPGFEDDPAHLNEKILEAVQMAWFEEFKAD